MVLHTALGYGNYGNKHRSNNAYIHMHIVLELTILNLMCSKLYCLSLNFYPLLEVGKMTETTVKEDRDDDTD